MHDAVAQARHTHGGGGGDENSSRGVEASAEGLQRSVRVNGEGDGAVSSVSHILRTDSRGALTMDAEHTAAQSRVGTTLGQKYELQRLVGVGGMGAVYESRNAWTGRRVAIKVLHPEFAKKPGVLGRFVQEAQVATRVVHPNIVEVLDLGQGEGDGAFYIVQEFIDGADLRSLMDEAGRVSPRRAVALMAPVMRALAAAHRAGVVHRDVKPENILVARDAAGATCPKVIDFGVSKLLDQPSTSRTLAGTTLGTPYYMSPEQARGDADLDGRSDVWAVGAVLYEMLSGALAFDADNYNLLIIKVCTERAPRLDGLAPELPPALVEAVHRALSPRREDRFETMESFLDALTACPLEGESLPPPMPLPARNDDPAMAATPMHWAATPPPVARPRRAPWAAMASGLAAVCAVVFALASRQGTAHARPAAVVASAPAVVVPALPAVVAPARAAEAAPSVAVRAARVAPTVRPRVVVRPAVTARAAAPSAVVGRSSNGALILAP